MRGIKIASRYAKSLLDLCVERGQTDAVFADMLYIRKLTGESKDLALLLQSPVVKADIKEKILSRILSGNVSELTMKFVNLLTQKGREGYLQEVAASFVAQMQRHRNITPATLVTAVALDAETRTRIIAEAKKLAGGEVEVIEKIDSNVIGGFVLTVGDRMVDTSVAGKLKKLRREFEENPYIPEI
ncbi:MAG: ATP synthase F1 subunit delta [Flavobacteriales bacterium]|nr:ATP synthase F1 subunit delta [Flavobacteriales bacterium]